MQYLLHRVECNMENIFRISRILQFILREQNEKTLEMFLLFYEAAMQ